MTSHHSPFRCSLGGEARSSFVLRLYQMAMLIRHPKGLIRTTTAPCRSIHGEFFAAYGRSLTYGTT